MRHWLLAGLLAASCSAAPPRDPWAYGTRRGYEPPRPCPHRELIPSCPAGTKRGMAVSESLLELDGQEVVVSGKPGLAGTSTGPFCPDGCCGHVISQILLCGGKSLPETPDCSVSVAVGVCGGDSCRLCCSHNVEEREIVARGRLRLFPKMIPGAMVVEPDGLPGVYVFQLDDASFCYLG